MAREITIRVPMAQHDFDDCLWIDMEEFGGQLKVVAKNDHIGMLDVEGGALAVHRRKLRLLGKVLIRLADVWEDVPT